MKCGKIFTCCKEKRAVENLALLIREQNSFIYNVESDRDKSSTAIRGLTMLHVRFKCKSLESDLKVLKLGER